MRTRACFLILLAVAGGAAAAWLPACRTGHTPPVLQPTRPGGPPAGLGTAPTVRVATAGARVVTLDLDDYVRGTIAQEIVVDAASAAWAAPIYEAQAIVARTFALASLGRHAGDGYDLCATTHCQLFQDRPAPTRWDDTIAEAVAATRGLVLAYAGEPITALFHAHCGGHTSDADLIWPGQPVPYLRGVPDPYCTRERPSAWTFRIPAGTLARALDASPDTRVNGRIDAVRVVERDQAGRAVLVALAGRSEEVVPGEALRRAVMAASGPASLRSPRYTVRREGDAFVFDGEGSGHGAGLCQIGMVARIKAGQSVEEVLGHYFQGAQLAPIQRLRGWGDT